jgi:hypothetical protein
MARMNPVTPKLNALSRTNAKLLQVFDAWAIQEEGPGIGWRRAKGSSGAISRL